MARAHCPEAEGGFSLCCGRFLDSHSFYSAAHNITHNNHFRRQVTQFAIRRKEILSRKGVKRINPAYGLYSRCSHQLVFIDSHTDRSQLSNSNKSTGVKFESEKQTKKEASAVLLVQLSEKAQTLNIDGVWLLHSNNTVFFVTESADESESVFESTWMTSDEANLSAKSQRQSLRENC